MTVIDTLSPTVFDIPNSHGKKENEFRNYSDDNNSSLSMVREHYRIMRMNQTVAFVDRMHDKFTFKDGKYRKKMTITEAFTILETYVDSSDPDVSLPNKLHMFQTAESIRKNNMPDWMQLTGLIHDMGKILFALGGTREDGMNGDALSPQWSLGGDTWVVGCKIPDCCVYSEFNCNNLDCKDNRYNTEYGLYTPNCGLDNVRFAYGHDEYLYQMCKANNTLLPEEALYMIRYHSAYPWHTGGAYKHLMNAKDEEMIPWIQKFNKFDLYTKDEAGLDGNATPDELWSYYQVLITKYFPNEKDGLMW